MMALIGIKVRTAIALGIPNIARALTYRMSVGLGVNPVRRLAAAVPDGPFFRAVSDEFPVVAPATSAWNGEARLFSRWPVALTSQPPDWLANPLTGQRVATPSAPWWEIPDFDPTIGDIKLIWEQSRMDWVLAFAQRARNGDTEELCRLNRWLADWCQHNPPYRGPNWKCGQEASMRVMHLSVAALLLNQVRTPLPDLISLVRLHLKRIAPTVQYAVAQDNNHGTSEAAALFIGGSWLAAVGENDGTRWMHMGRRWLENRAARLIGAEGSFSQYSLNYHRVVLDTFCVVEIWRRHLSLSAFSTQWQKSASTATEWLRNMVNPYNGDGPNVGANDGARLLQLADTEYRDHRPTVQLAMALFENQRAYAQDGSWNIPLRWLGIPLPEAVAAAPGHYIADDGGFALLRRGTAMAMLRYPRFRFRPSQSDLLHLDLWIGKQNVLRDAGTYSYNTDAKWQDYFGGSSSHNTVQIDGRDQMPRLSRFLFGNWLKTKYFEALSLDMQGAHFSVGYCDDQGASHRRHVSLGRDHLRVRDDIAGFSHRAVLRWRMMPGAWRLVQVSEKVELINEDEGMTICVETTVPIVRCELVEGWESRHYLEKTTVPVLEIEIGEAGRLLTDVRWMV